MALTGLLLGGLDSPTSRAAGTGGLDSSHEYYLALGDSVAFGYRQAQADSELASGHPFDPATFNTGYVDDFARMLDVVLPGIHAVNLACPGETSLTFLQPGGCPWLPVPLHTNYAGSQMDAALAFLHAHPDQVKVITLSLGLSDAFDLPHICHQCVNPSFLDTPDQTEDNLIEILTSLYQAAPGSEILVPQYESPFATSDASKDAEVGSLNAVIDEAADESGSGAISVPAPTQTASEPQFFCGPATVCFAGPTMGSQPADPHPSTGGYALMADGLWAASGYAAMGNLAMVGFDSAVAGEGRLIFGSSCNDLLGSATQDMHPGTTTHDILVTVNDLPSLTGFVDLTPGTVYPYETVTVGKSSVITDTNQGQCYTFTMPGSSSGCTNDHDNDDKGLAPGTNDRDINCPGY